MFNINDYIVETIVFAHVMPITRNYAILVFLGRKKKAICNRLIFALARFDNGEMTIVDEISLPSCDMLRENSEILLASDSVNINFKIGDSSTATVSYTDHDFFAEEADVSEKYTFRFSVGYSVKNSLFLPIFRIIFICSKKCLHSASTS